tara:strand:+ start:202 stop:465 length:264 start_codon:yes stop_codon:yes gene_type:complete
MSSFVYYNNQYIIINGRRFSERVFKELHPHIDIGNAKTVSYDRETHILHDGMNQWGGPVPWEDGDQILLRFHDLCMVEKYLEGKNNK